MQKAAVLKVQHLNSTVSAKQNLNKQQTIITNNEQQMTTGLKRKSKENLAESKSSEKITNNNRKVSNKN